MEAQWRTLLFLCTLRIKRIYISVYISEKWLYTAAHAQTLALNADVSWMVPTAAEHAAQPHFSQLQQQLLQDREMQEAEGERAAKESGADLREAYGWCLGDGDHGDDFAVGA